MGVGSPDDRIGCGVGSGVGIVVGDGLGRWVAAAVGRRDGLASASWFGFGVGEAEGAGEADGATVQAARAIVKARQVNATERVFTLSTLGEPPAVRPIKRW